MLPVVVGMDGDVVFGTPSFGSKPVGRLRLKSDSSFIQFNLMDFCLAFRSSSLDEIARIA